MHGGSMADVVMAQRTTLADVMNAAQGLRAANQKMMAVAAHADGSLLGEALIQIREAGIDPLEATFAEGLRRFDQSGEYAADGATSPVAWLRWKCKLSAGAAAERLTVARHVDQLPKTEKAFARGELSYQHVAVLARTAEHIGDEAVRRAETNLLKAAETRDPGQLVGVAKDSEHRVDPGSALAEANAAYQRRYLHIGEPVDGLVRLDGLLDVEGGATVRRALNMGMLPGTNDERSAGQRRADRLVEICGGLGAAKGQGTASRPHLVIRTNLETLTRAAGAPAGEIEDGGCLPSDAVRRLACDASIIRIIGRAEIDLEISRASRTVGASTRRAVEARDRHCVFPGCDRPPIWCDSHHLMHWADGGETTVSNLALLCRIHHRKVHEEGFTLSRVDGRWLARPPEPRCRRN
jgi:Domain of unknown function (DUF222)/HNH endonuclease